MLCAIPLEISNRELDGALYLAMHLAQKGMPTLLGERMVNEYVFRLNQGHPVLYFDQDGSAKTNARVNEKGGTVISLSNEGIVFEDSPNFPIFAHIAETVTDICVWGEMQLELFKKHFSDKHKKLLRLTGSPLFDLLSEKDNAYYREQSIVDKYGDDYILINTNFTMFNLKMDFDKYMKMLGKMDEWAIYNDPKVQQELQHMREYQERVIESFIDLIKVLAKEFPNRHIIVRPHAMENSKLYSKRLQGLKNVDVTNDGPVRKWIASAGTVIHHDCTTGTEAFLMDKPVIRYQAVYDETHVVKVLTEIGLKVRSPEEAVATIRKNKMPQDIYDKQMRVLKPYFANLSMGTSSAAKVADIAEQYADREKTWLPEPLGFMESCKCWRKHLSKLLRSLQPGHNGRKVRYAMAKFPRLPLAEVEKRIRKMRMVDPSLPKVTVNHLALNTFSIVPEDF